MVYEALSSGAPVAVIEMPRKVGKNKEKISRVARGLNMLVADGAVCTFTAWAKEHQIPQTGDVLDEAGRTADYILKKFPQLIP
jgi:hypothetical protein